MPLKLYRLKAVVFTLGLENKGSPWGVNVVIHAIADGKKAAMKIDQRRIVKKALPVSSGIYVYLHCVEAGGTRLSRHMDLYAAYHWYYMSGPGPLL